MQLDFVLCITDRDKQPKMEKVYDELGLKLRFSMLGRGTAKSEHLSLHDLSPTEKTVIGAMMSPDQARQLFKLARRKMYIDIPGNGIMMAIPVKSIGGGKTLAYLTENGVVAGGAPKMDFDQELIVVIMNEGYSDTVMDAARSAGAGGGTVLHAKGTGASMAKTFFGVTLASEKDMVYIVATAKQKTAIMQAIARQAGTATPAGAFCFSLPISSVVGLRMAEEE